MSKPAEGSSIQGALRTVAMLGAAMAIVAATTFGRRASISVAFGAALAVANLYVLGRVVRAMLPAPEEEAAAPQVKPGEANERPRGSAAAWGVFAAIKVVALFGVVIVAVNTGWVDLLGFLAGYGAMPLGIVTAQLTRAMSAR